jgi:hypothetical protein
VLVVLGKAFMPTGYKTQLTRQIGEHLAVAELGKRGIIATPFAGNVPNFDILAASQSGISLPIQVKAINGPSWQFSATSFLEIEFHGNEQVIKGKKKFSNPSLPCVFIHIKKEGPVFFILKWSALQNHFYKNYKGGIRPKNPKSTHCAIWPKELEKYRDNWELITKNFS